MKRLNCVSLTAVTVLSRSFQLRKELYRNKLNRPKRKRKNYKTKSGKREKNSRKWRYSYATVINSSVYDKHGKKRSFESEAVWMANFGEGQEDN